MDQLTLWLTVGAIAAACVVSMLYVAAAVLRDEHRTRELHLAVARLRDDYQRRLRTAMTHGGATVVTFPDGEDPNQTPAQTVGAPAAHRKAA